MTVHLQREKQNLYYALFSGFIAAVHMKQAVAYKRAVCL